MQKWKIVCKQKYVKLFHIMSFLAWTCLNFLAHHCVFKNVNTFFNFTEFFVCLFFFKCQYFLKFSDQQQQQQPKVVMRRSKSGGQQNEDRKKNRNSKLLRGLGSMFKIGSNSIERTKDTKVMTRKSMPSPETLTNSGKFHGIFR